MQAGRTVAASKGRSNWRADKVRELLIAVRPQFHPFDKSLDELREDAQPFQIRAAASCLAYSVQQLASCSLPSTASPAVEHDTQAIVDLDPLVQRECGRAG